MSLPHSAPRAGTGKTSALGGLLGALMTIGVVGVGVWLWNQASDDTAVTRQSVAAAVEDVGSTSIEKDVAITSIHTQWVDGVGETGGGIAVPAVRLTVKNVGQEPIAELRASVTFENEQSKVRVGDGTADIVSVGESPLKPGYSASALVESPSGWDATAVMLSPPKLIGELFLESSDDARWFVKKIPITTSLLTGDQ